MYKNSKNNVGTIDNIEYPIRPLSSISSFSFLNIPSISLINNPIDCNTNAIIINVFILFLLNKYSINLSIHLLLCSRQPKLLTNSLTKSVFS